MLPKVFAIADATAPVRGRGRSPGNSPLAYIADEDKITTVHLAEVIQYGSRKET